MIGMEDEIDLDMDMDDEDEEMAMESLKKRVGSLLESYVDVKKTKVVKSSPQKYLKSKMSRLQETKKIKKHYNSIEQELSCEKFLKENKSFKFKRKTESGKIILENSDKKVWVLRNGSIK